MRPGVERREEADVLRDDERRVIEHHDAAGADVDALRVRRDVGGKQRGLARGNAGHAVVLGEEEALEAEALDVAGVAHDVRKALAGRTGGTVEDRETHLLLRVTCGPLVPAHVPVT